MICAICGKEFKSIGTHIQYAHKDITYKEYYDTFIRKENEGICKTCGKETRFLGITRGYNLYCSKECKYKSGASLATIPDLVKEWDYEKNYPLVPDDFSTRSNKSVWWVCDKGHQWQALISNRSAGKGCPYCGNKKVIVGYNDLATTHPRLAMEWNHEKNGDLLPTMVVAGSNKKVWWKCKYGHIWKTTIAHRALDDRGCPKCSNHSSIAEHGIAFYLKQVCEVISQYRIRGKEVDVFLPQYNIGIEYDGVYFHKNKIIKDLAKSKQLMTNGIQVIRIIETDKDNIEEIVDNDGIVLIYYKPDSMGNRYETALKTLLSYLSSITSNTSFQQIDVDINRDRAKIREDYGTTLKENSLAVKCPQIAKEWDYEKNGSLTPEMFLYKAREKVWWKCDKGHSWRVSIDSRTGDNTYCPYCANKKVLAGFNDLATLDPLLASEWNYEKNVGLTNRNGEDISSPDKITIKSNQKVWWKCSKCGYEWISTVNNRSNGQGCFQCNRISNRYKKVENTDTKIIYKSINEAGQELGISTSSISECCKGKRKTAGGYHWKYADC